MPTTLSPPQRLRGVRLGVVEVVVPERPLEVVGLRPADVVQRPEDSLEAKALFIRLGAMDDEGARLWQASTGRVDEGDPGSWHNWRERHHAEAGALNGTRRPD